MFVKKEQKWIWTDRKAGNTSMASVSQSKASLMLGVSDVDFRYLMCDHHYDKQMEGSIYVQFLC